MKALLLRLIREPLLHFLAIGAIFFALLGRGDQAPPAGEITISKDDIARIAAGFASTWQRPPSADELRGAVNDHIREEVLYRTGIELGLDKNDTIVRRRIEQKMEFFLEGSVEAPTDNDLRQFLAENPDKFRTDARFAFRQVFVNAKRGDARAQAEALLPKLVSAGPDTSAFGDAMLLPEAFDLTPLRDIAAQFGDGFAQALSTAKTGAWWGPIASAYGYHLVLVTGMEPARLPDLGEIRGVVEREWYARRRQVVLDAKYAQLRARYVVRYDDGAPAP